MRIVLITGMSGSGKTIALKHLEDMDFYCVDNLPVELLPKFIELLADKKMQDIAICMDIRSGENLFSLDTVLNHIHDMDIDLKILFMEAGTETLIKRYKETRRKHPITGSLRVEEGIEKEREQLRFLKQRADYILDTSGLFTKELKAELVKIFSDGGTYHNIFVNILSFGFMYGIPKDVDLMFDVRFLPNPFYDKDLKLKTGEDKAVSDFVFADAGADIFMDKLVDMVEFLLPRYIEEGKTQLVIGIGCTGGQHRSVAVANRLYQRLCSDKNRSIKLENRDALKNINRIS